MACSPSSDPTARSKYEEYLKGKYRFWGVVVAEESVTTPAAPLRPAATFHAAQAKRTGVTGAPATRAATSHATRPNTIRNRISPPRERRALEQVRH